MPIPVPIQTRIEQAKRRLDAARIEGDALHVDLAESALNDLLEAFQTVQTEGNDDDPLL